MTTEPLSARRLLRLAMPSPMRFAVVLAWGVISAGAAVSLLAVSGWLIVSASIVDSLVPLSVAVVGVRFFAVTRAVTRYLERLSGHDEALRRLAPVRAELVERLVPLSPAGLGNVDRGAVLSALVDDVENLQNLPLRVVQPLAVGGLVGVLTVVFTAIVSPPAAVALGLCLVLAAAGSIAIGGVLGSRAERSIALRRSGLSSALVDYLGSMDELLAFGADADARERIRRADRSLRTAVTRAAIAQSAAAAVVSVLAGVASLGILLVTAPGLASSVIDGPWLTVVVLLPMAVFDVFGVVPQAAASWRSVRASADRIVSALPRVFPAELRADDPRADASSDEREEEAVTSTSTPALHLRGVRAAWPGGAEALRGIDLDLAPGERLLVTGPSGAGKSTLAAVLVGFLRAEGEYRLGDLDATAMPGPELRATIGLCEQQPMLFDEDIRQNLLFARDTASDDELMAVLERVGLGDWVRERGGLDARVGERGVLVSGGQAQRIALARALLRGFPVLVLDEPAAGVDPAASDALLRDLLDAASGQSVLLISHVDPPAGTVDRTVRLEAGRIAGDQR